MVLRGRIVGIGRIGIKLRAVIGQGSGPDQCTCGQGQKRHDGSSDHHPAPTHVRFERADDPIIVSPAVLDGSDPGS